jgi:arginine decarboxylase
MFRASGPGSNKSIIYETLRCLKTNVKHRAHARSPRFVISPFVQALDACLSIDVWATPSIIPGLHVPIKTGEYSISMNGFGSHLDNTGLLGDVAKRAARHRFADCAVLTSSGTTSSNHKVMLMLHSEYKGRCVLVSRNCHHSVILSAQIYGVKLCFINNPPWVDAFDAMLPPTAKDVEDALRRHPDACAVLISSPTYEGVIADIEEIAHTVHTKSSAILWVDQAWGSHLGTSLSVPKSAIQLGADIVCESVHKNGGALQGSALLLWKRGPFVSDRSIFEAHMKEETTSPNFNIFASIDSALLRLEQEPELVDDLCDLISDVKERLSDERDLVFLQSQSIQKLCSSNSNQKPLLIDPTRLCIGFNGRSGSEIRQYLERHYVEVEKIGRRSLLLIATFQLPPQASEHVATEISEALRVIPYNAVYDRILPSPYENCCIEPADQVEYQSEIVDFENSVDQIADETIECYPPGIPIIIPGFRISSDSIQYLLTMRELGASIVATDRTLQTIRIKRVIFSGRDGISKNFQEQSELDLIL